MEAATPLHKPHVRLFGDRLAIDGLVIDDECTVRLVREGEGDPAKLVTDAIEIGARVLDREQAGASAEWIKGELERAIRDVEGSFRDRASEVTEQLAGKVDEVFAPDSGHLTKALEHHFSDGSSAAVQNRVRELVAEVMTKSREDLLRQFSAEGGHNPLADLKARTIDALREASQRQDSSLHAMLEKMGALERELQSLKDERGKNEEIAAEHERGTAKGREFEEVVAEAIDEIARAQGDDSDAVGDRKGATRKTGDVVVEIDACNGPARGRIVFEAKNARLSRSAALDELARGLAERDADFAVLVVPGEDRVPAKMHELREYNGDKLVVTFDPAEGSRLPLELAYRQARARVLLTRAPGGEVDAAAVREAVERALAAMDDVRRVKSQLSGAKTSIENARGIADEMASRVRALLEQIDSLVKGT